MILLVNAYSARNAGDAGIVLSTAQLLAAVQPGTKILVASRYWRQDKQFYAGHGLTAVSTPIIFPPRGDAPSWLRAGLFAVTLVSVVVGTLLVRLLPRRLFACLAPTSWWHYLTADVICAVGGGYLYSSQRPLDLTLLHNAAMMLLGRLWGRRVMMMPQSIGPITSPVDAAVVRTALTATDRIVVRESNSRDECVRIGCPAHRIVVLPDVAFFTLPGGGASARATDMDRRRVVGLVAMDWIWARPGTNPNDLQLYIEKLATFCLRLQKAGLTVRIGGHSSLPGHGQDDFDIGARVSDEAVRRGGRGRDIELVQAPSVDPLGTSLALIDSVGVLVGTRLHSCILALRRGVPAIALGYQPKAAGTYALLGLNDLYWDVQAFEPGNLAAKTLAILAELEQETARVHAAATSAAESLIAYYRAAVVPASTLSY